MTEIDLRTAIASQARIRSPEQTGMYLLTSGQEAFAARAELFRNARYSIALQYYIAEDGISTRLLLDELMHAARRGVRVRLLLDDLSADARDQHLLACALRAGVEARAFNPPRWGRRAGEILRFAGRLLDPSRQHRRMHNKLVMVDDALAIFGGRNLGDEYYDADPDTNMVDIDLLCGGAILADAARSFEEYWGHVLAVPIEHCMNRKHAADASEADVQRALETSRAERPEVFARLASYQSAPNLAQQLDEMIWGQAKLVWDPPGKALTKGEPPFQQLMVSQLVEEATALQSELVMASAYLVPGKAGCAWLSGAVERGAKVSVLTNSLAANDVPPMHAGYVRWRDSMLGAGIQLWELRSDPQPGGRYNLARTSSSLHTKTAVWDRRHVVLGPLNLDPRSVLWNTENALLIESPELGEAIRALLLEGMTPDNSFDVRKAGPKAPVALPGAWERAIS